VIDVYLSATRDTAAATAFFERALARTDVRPQLVTTDKAPTYPPALRPVTPEAEHIMGKAEQQGIERDHQHLKGRTRCMRGFQQLRCAQVVCDGHGFMRNPRDGFYRLGQPIGDPRLTQAPGLMRAWEISPSVLPRHSCPGQPPTMASSQRRLSVDLSTPQRHPPPSAIAPEHGV